MIDDLNQKMSNAVSHLEKEFNTIRTSRANPSMLDNIFADAYGSKTPLNQLGNISTPDPSTITIQVWDTSLIKSIENSILDSGLGINPQIDGQIIRLPIPKLSEERREELTKLAAKYAENSKVVIRNLRRDFLDSQKDLKKNSELSEDDLKKIINDVQKLTDSSIEKIDELLMIKKEDILKV
jgi:ribosome recycling factor